MAFQRVLASTITNASFNSLANSLTAVASSSATTIATSSNVVDHQVVVGVTVGAITASASTLVNIFCYGSADGTTWPGGASTTEVISGTDQAITWSSFGNAARYLGFIPCHTASIKLTSEPLSIAAAFGGTLPAKYVVVIQNQSGVALAASGNSVIAEEVYYT